MDVAWIPRCLTTSSSFVQLGTDMFKTTRLYDFYSEADAAAPPGCMYLSAILSTDEGHHGLRLLQQARQAETKDGEREKRRREAPLPLDLPTNVGQLDLHGLRHIAQPNFGKDACDILQDETYAAKRCFRSADLSIQTQIMQDSPPKTPFVYHDHLEELERAKVLHCVAAVTCLLLVCTYFAVAKGCGQLSRTIFNGSSLKAVCITPPPVNLVDLILLLRLIAPMRRLKVYVADIRGWFHVIPICSFLQSCFGIVCGSEKCRKIFQWLVLPMGWSWSPYIAQSLAWSVILHHLDCDKYYFVETGPVDSPPQYRWVYNRNTRVVVGLVTLLYDNIGFFGFDQDVIEDFKKRVQHTAEQLRIPLKYSVLTTTINMDVDRRSLDQDTFPIYRGVQIGVRGREKRAVYRLDPSRIRKYSLWPTPVAGLEGPLNVMARYAGVILWRATVLLACNQQCMADYAGVVSVSRKLAKLAGGDKRRWRNMTTTLTAEDASALQPFWRTLLENAWIQPVLYEDIGEVHIIATDAQDDDNPGWGITVMSQEHLHADHYEERGVTWGGPFRGGMRNAGIFLQELGTATWGIQCSLKQGHRNIVIAVDNTGAAGVLRRLYSHNETANRWMIGLHKALRDARAQLRVVTVRSQDNAADAASRYRKLKSAEYRLCWEAIQAELAGWRCEVPTCWGTGETRDFDPEDFDGAAVDVLNDCVGPLPGEDSGHQAESILGDYLFTE